MFDDQLSPQQLTVISALSSGASVSEAAAQAGVHRNTITNWRRNLQEFQLALDHAHYDRALYFREKIEAEIDIALQTLHDILADPKAPASVRLRAALAAIQTATQQPEPKKEVMLYFQPLQMPIPAQTERPRAPQTRTEPPVHNSAQSQSIRRTHPKVGRNEPCPCGSGQKFKRCCIDRPGAAAAA
ncbi:MAG TPA: SEC-C metal-binding domain-containing protein [Bryobacteraceae bacterium]|jgi:transposase-like protein